MFLGRGFCFFNSVAIAARQLQQKGKIGKILIVDWVSSSFHLSDRKFLVILVEMKGNYLQTLIYYPKSLILPSTKLVD